MIICLQESHLITDNPLIKGYNCVNKNSGFNRARGGVLTAVKNNIQFINIQINTNIEAIAIKLNVPFELTICNIYISPSFTLTYKDVENLIRQLDKPFIIVGDINAHSDQWGSTSTDRRGKIFEKIIDDLDLNILNSGIPTHFSVAYGTFSSIDISFSSNNLPSRLEWSVIDDLHNSDHYPISLSFLLNKTQRTKRKKWILKEADWSTYSTLVSENFKNVHVRTVDRSINEFTKAIVDAATVSIPQTSIKSKRVPVPWWNDEIKQTIKLRRKALKRFNIQPSQDNLIMFKKYRAKVRFLINKSKKSSWEKFVSSISMKTSLSLIFNKINKISGVSRINHSPIIIQNNNTLTDPFLVATAIGKQFQNHSSGEYYSNKFKAIQMNFNINFNLDEDTNSFYNMCFNIYELEFALSKSKGLSAGSDNVCYDMIKNLSLESKYDLLNIYNTIWNIGEFPKNWTTALVIPILKPNSNPQDPNGYRPISLTSCLCKVFEKKRLTWFIETKNLLSEFQCGFRKQRSTMDHLITLENVIQEAFSNRKNVGVVFFDLKKAYDRVWRFGIVKVLDKWGIKGKFLVFIKNFLLTRTFQVIIGNTTSEPIILPNGIPQGSVLSTTLFLCFINNIFEYIEAPVIGLLYADDLALYCCDKNMKKIGKTLQKTINKLYVWADTNGMEFSPDKTKFVLFTRTLKDYLPPRLFLNNLEIERVPSFKFLGLCFDSKLTWQDHIQQLKKSCYSKMRALKLVSNKFWGTDQETLLLLYKALIQSRIDYGSSVYSSARPKFLKSLDPILNSGIRISIGAFKSSPVISLLIESGLPSLENRRNFFIVKTAIDVVNKPSHPIKYMFNNNTEQMVQKYMNKPNSTKPMAFRAFRLLLILKAPINIFRSVSSDLIDHIPPWTILPAEVNFELAKHKKSQASALEYNQLFCEILDELQGNSVIIYTDGSKSDIGVGCAYIDIENNKTFKMNLPCECSVFTAELVAILEAVKYALESPLKNYTICSDSMSALQSMRNIYTENKIVIDILQKIRHLKINFIWIPGHCSIKGNELADSLAKEALEIPTNLNYLASKNDLKTYIKFLNKKVWADLWKSMTNNKLRHVKESTERWKSPSTFSRREAVAVTRLRIGHTWLTHGYLMEKKDPPICSVCNVIITVEHLLTQCNKFKNLLLKYNFNDSLKDILQPNVVFKLKSFLLESNLINEL